MGDEEYVEMEDSEAQPPENPQGHDKVNKEGAGESLPEGAQANPGAGSGDAAPDVGGSPAQEGASYGGGSSGDGGGASQGGGTGN